MTTTSKSNWGAVELPDVVCPIPRGLSHDDARAEYLKVRKEMKGLTDSAIRREAARRLGVDYDTYLKAWKKPKNSPPVTPSPVTPVPPRPMPDLPKPTPPPAPQPLPTLTHDTARAQYKLVKKENPSFTDAQIRREAARRMGVDYDSYLRAWKKPKDGAPAPKPDRAHVPNPPVIKPSPRTPEKKSLWKRKQPGPMREITSGRGLTKKHAVNSQQQQRFDYLDGDQLVGKITKFSYSDRYYVSAPGIKTDKLFESMNEAEDFLRRLHNEGLPDHMAANPGYGIRGTTKNCPSTTSSWELRRRGYDVVARKMDNGAPLQHIFNSWGIRSEHMISRAKSKWSPIANSTNRFHWYIDSGKLPDGARGFITVVWKDGGAHIWNWEIRDGELWYIDAQPGKEWRAKDDKYLERAEDFFWVARVDEIEETPNIGWLTSDTTQTTTKNPWEL